MPYALMCTETVRKSAGNGNGVYTPCRRRGVKTFDNNAVCKQHFSMLLRKGGSIIATTATPEPASDSILDDQMLNVLSRLPIGPRQFVINQIEDLEGRLRAFTAGERRWP